VLLELLRRLALELEHPLVAHIRLYEDGRDAGDGGVVATARDGEPQHGEIRVRFRVTGAPTRYLFFADSLFDADARTPTFSGFSVRGDVQDVGGTLEANFSTWVVKREDREWSKWL